MKYILPGLFLFFSLNIYSATTSENTKSIYQMNQIWTTQNNKKTNINALRGHTTIITMIFTSCPGVCPLMISDMKSFDIQLNKTEKTKIKFVAFSIDPARDTPDTLKKFYSKMKLDSRWTLLTSNDDQVREMAAILGFGYKDVGDGDFTHSSTLFLLSADGEILARKERNSDWKEFLVKFRSEIKK